MAILKETDIPKVTPVEVHTKAEVMQVIRDNLDNFKLFGVIEVGLFGSFVREEATDQSDVDLLVNLQEYDYYNFFNLHQFAESLFIDRSVDIITEAGITVNNGIYICREVEYVTKS
jgi:predicted nucleotidyltransferase